MKLTPRQTQILAYLHQHLQVHGLPPTLHELMQAFGWASPTGAAKHLQALAAKGVIALSPGKARGIHLLQPPPADDGQAPRQHAPRPALPALARALHPASHAAPRHAAAGMQRAANDTPGGDAEPAWVSGSSFGSSSGSSSGPQADTLRLPLVGRVAAGLPILAGGHIERHLVVDRWVFRPRPDFLLRVQGDSMIDDGILDGDLVAGKTTPHAEHGQIVIARLGDGITIKRLHHQNGRLRLLPRNARHAPIDPDPVEGFAIEGIYCGLMRRPEP